jgi:hypothetical protein
MSRPKKDAKEDWLIVLHTRKMKLKNVPAFARTVQA